MQGNLPLQIGRISNHGCIEKTARNHPIMTHPCLHDFRINNPPSTAGENGEPSMVKSFVQKMAIAKSKEAGNIFKYLFLKIVNCKNV